MPARAPRLTVRIAAVAALTVPLLAACTSSGSSAQGINVQAGADICTAAPAEAKAGTVSINVNWVGEGPGEVYLYAQENGEFTKVAGEVEDLTDGLTKSFTAEVTAGDYEIACKVGADTVGARTPLAVS